MVHWLKEEDGNTSFFHKIVSNRRRVNVTTSTIARLGEDAWTEEVKRLVTRVFKSSFKCFKGIQLERWVHIILVWIGRNQICWKPCSQKRRLDGN